LHFVKVYWLVYMLFVGHVRGLGVHFHHGVNAAVIHLDDIVLFLEVCHEYSHDSQW
jgi:hypothetical protein